MWFDHGTLKVISQVGTETCEVGGYGSGDVLEFRVDLDEGRTTLLKNNAQVHVANFSPAYATLLRPFANLDYVGEQLTLEASEYTVAAAALTRRGKRVNPQWAWLVRSCLASRALSALHERHIFPDEVIADFMANLTDKGRELHVGAAAALVDGLPADDKGVDDLPAGGKGEGQQEGPHALSSPGPPATAPLVGEEAAPLVGEEAAPLVGEEAAPHTTGTQLAQAGAGAGIPDLPHDEGMPADPADEPLTPITESEAPPDSSPAAATPNVDGPMEHNARRPAAPDVEVFADNRMFGLEADIQLMQWCVKDSEMFRLHEVVVLRGSDTKEPGVAKPVEEEEEDLPDEAQLLMTIGAMSFEEADSLMVCLGGNTRKLAFTLASANLSVRILWTHLVCLARDPPLNPGVDRNLMGHLMGRPRLR